MFTMAASVFTGIYEPLIFGFQAQPFLRCALKPLTLVP